MLKNNKDKGPNKLMESEKINNDQITNKSYSLSKNGNICNKNCRCLGCENTSINIKKEVISPSIPLNEIKNKNNCKCKSSNCFNLYCNCKRRGILCSKDCECSNCKNYKKSLKK